MLHARRFAARVADDHDVGRVDRAFTLHDLRYRVRLSRFLMPLLEVDALHGHAAGFRGRGDHFARLAFVLARQYDDRIIQFNVHCPVLLTALREQER